MPSARRPHPGNVAQHPPSAVAARGLLFTHLVIAPLLFARVVPEPFERPKNALLATVAVVLVAGGLMAALGRWSAGGSGWRHRRSAGGSRDLLGLGVAAFTASAILSTACSLSPRTSLLGAEGSFDGLGTVVAYAVLFFATRAVCRGGADARRLLHAPVLAAALAAAYSLVQAAGADPLRWEGVSALGGLVRPFATLGHPNHLGAFLTMAWPFAAYFADRAARRRQWGRLVAYGTVAALAGLVVVLTLSRGAWLASAAAVAVLCVGWLRTGRRAPVLAVAGFVGVGLILAVVGGAGAGGRLLARCGQFGDWGPRPHIWLAGLRIWADHPLVGCGPDAFQLAFQAHRTTAYWAAEWGATPAQAHNELIHLLATQGVGGGVAVLLLAAGLAGACRRAWARGAPADRPLVAALAAALVGWAVQGCFSFTTAGCGTLLVTAAALASRLGWPRAPDGRAAPAPPPAWRAGPLTLVVRLSVAAGAAAILVAWVVQPFRAAVACAAGDGLLADDPRGALGRLDRAVALDPMRDTYWAKLGAAAEQCAAGDPDDAGRWLDRARAAYRRAAELVPAAAYHHASLGRVTGLLARTGRAGLAEAYAEYATALRLDPNNAYYYADAGRTAFLLGDPERARGYWQAGLGRYPHFASLLAQTAALALTERRTGDGVRLLQQAAGSDWQGEEQGRLTALARLTDLLLAERRYDEALAAVRQIRQAAPDHAGARLAERAILQAVGRPGP